jgi:hypothetical protein
MNQSILQKYRNKVEPWKKKALTQEPMRPEQLIREDWDRSAFEAILFAKIELIHETRHRSIREADELYYEIFDVFAMADEFSELRQWLLQPPDNRLALNQRLETMKRHVRDLHRKSVDGDDSPGLQLAFMLVQHILADIDKIRQRFEALRKTDHEIYRECFIG